MLRIWAKSSDMMTLKQQQQPNQTRPYEREPTAVAAPDEQWLNEGKVEPNKVAQGMATLEQEQQLWRPGVKAEQVFTNMISHL